MALTSVLCCAIIVLLVSVNLAEPLELPQSLHRVQRALLSEKPTEELNALISNQLSRSNVQSLLKGIVPNEIQDLRSRSANEDLVEGFLRSRLENPDFRSSLLRAAASDDVQAIIEVLNSALGLDFFAVSNSSIIIDVDVLESISIAYSTKYIQENYKDDFFLQIIVTGVVNGQIKTATAKLRSYLADKTIPLDCINALVHVVRGSSRSKRDLNSLLFDLLRPQIAAILSPIQAEVNAVLNGISATIFSIYIPSQPTDPIMGLISSTINTLCIRLAELVADVQVTFNDILSNLINGTTTAVSRKRRDIDLELDDLYDFDKVALAFPHSRATRSLDLFGDIGGLINGILITVTETVNSLVKNVFMNILTSQYYSIGEIITLPLRVVVQWLIDTILPCSTCVSIV